MKKTLIDYDVINKIVTPQPKKYLQVRIIYYNFSLINAMAGYFEDIGEDVGLSSDNNRNGVPRLFLILVQLYIRCISGENLRASLNGWDVRCYCRGCY